uniref:Uncharacterized protein n=1 Tax=Steinernema glaseri TaxID=37863 RepID=A0A1I7Y2D6_9BILA
MSGTSVVLSTSKLPSTYYSCNLQRCLMSLALGLAERDLKEELLKIDMNMEGTHLPVLKNIQALKLMQR